MSIKKLAAFGIIVAIAASARANTITWSGSADTDWATDGNWVGNVAPVNDDFTDIARFAENSPANKTPNVAGGRSVNKLYFDNSTGWSITGGAITLKYIESSGIGINTVNSIKVQASNYSWSIATGSTVKFNSMIQDGNGHTITLSGGGSLVIGNKISYSFSNNNRIRINDGLLRIDANTAYLASGGNIRINSTTAIYELMTTVADANLQITNGKIVDETGLGLGVTDLNNGYVRIAAVPEPASIALLACGLGLVIRRQSRKA